MRRESGRTDELIVTNAEQRRCFQKCKSGSPKVKPVRATLQRQTVLQRSSVPTGRSTASDVTMPVPTMPNLRR